MLIVCHDAGVADCGFDPLYHVANARLLVAPAFLPDPEKVVERGHRVVLASGAESIKRFQRAGWYPYAGGTRATRLRPHWNPDLSLWVCTSAALNVGDVDEASEVDLICDLKAYERLERTGSLSPQVGRYGYARDLWAVYRVAERLYERSGKPTPVSVDLETEGLDPHDPDKHILSVSASATEGVSDLVYLPDCDGDPDRHRDVVESLDAILNAPFVKVVGANFKFDLLWLRVKWGITCSRFGFDSCLVGSLLNENRSNNLNIHTKLYAPDLGGYDDEFNARYSKSDMASVPKADLLTYAGGDTDAALRCYRAMRSDLLKDGNTLHGKPGKRSLTSLYVNIVHPAALAVHEMEATGVCVDLERFHAFGAELQQEMDDATALATGLLPDALLENDGTAALSKASVVAKYLFDPEYLGLDAAVRTEKSGKPSTAKAHLQQFEDHVEAGPLVGAFLRYSAAAKLHGTYYKGFLNHLRADGRWHATYMLHKVGGDGLASEGQGGTVSGRASATGPAMQTVPKHGDTAKKLRRAFVAPDGHVILGADYSQGELRVAACWAKEPTMLAAYKNGVDLHAMTAANTLGMTYEQLTAIKSKDVARYKSLRQRGKAGNFGLLYGMQARGFQAYAKAVYGVDMTLEEAEAYVETHFGLYSGLRDWHGRQIAEARTYGYVRSPLGRVRRLRDITSNNGKARGHARRQAINSPIQSTLVDLSWWALALVHQRAPWLLPFAQVHDQNLWYCPEDRFDEGCQIVKETMENLPITERFGWEPDLPFVTDLEWGYNLGEMVEL